MTSASEPLPRAGARAAVLGEARALGPRSRVAVLLAGVRPSQENADRWLIQLRWFAIAGMASTIVVATQFVPRLDPRPLVAVLAAIVAMNVAWTVAVRLRARRAAAEPPPAPPALRDGEAQALPGTRYVDGQIVADVVALTVMLWFAGGVHNPFAVFLAFQIALAGLLCSPRTTVSIAALTILAVGVLARAAPLPLEDAGGEGGRVARLAQVMSIASVSAFLAVFVSVYAQRVEALRQESARNEKLALLGRLVGSMSHELSTPLATVLLASNELVEITRESGHKDIERLTKTLAGEAQRASDIIGVVRGHIRPDLQRERVELVAFVRELADAELDRLGFRGRRELWAPEPVTALVLKPALRQVLVNLLTNAAEACARRDQDPRIAISVTRFGDVAEVTVADSGPGFSDDILPRLGEPFQSTKEEQGGMGLGLYVCSMLARRMNAVLRAESAEDGGARVTLSILLGSAPAAEEAQRS